MKTPEFNFPDWLKLIPPNDKHTSSRLLELNFDEGPSMKILKIYKVGGLKSKNPNPHELERFEIPLYSTDEGLVQVEIGRIMLFLEISGDFHFFLNFRGRLSPLLSCIPIFSPKIDHKPFRFHQPHQTIQTIRPY